MLTDTLEQIGLNKKQAKVYLVCLELGPTTILKIAKKTGFNRTTVYKVVNDLINKKMLIISIQGKKKTFIAETPEKVKLILKEKISRFSDIIPELSSLISQNKIKPILKYYDGIEGIKKVYLDCLSAKEDFIPAFTGVKELTRKSKAVQQFYEKEFIPKRKKIKKHVKLIVPDNKEGRCLKSRDKQEYRETKFVPASFYNFKCEIFFYENIVAFISYSEKEEFALTIQSELIADTLRMIWRMCWNMGY